MDGIWKVAAGASVIGLIAGMWDKIKTFGWRALNLLVQRIDGPGSPMDQMGSAAMRGASIRPRNNEPLPVAPEEMTVGVPIGKE